MMINVKFAFGGSKFAWGSDHNHSLTIINLLKFFKGSNSDNLSTLNSIYEQLLLSIMSIIAQSTFCTN